MDFGLTVLNLSSRSSFLRFLLGIFLEDAQDILNRLRVLVRTVVGRDDVFGLRTIHVRAPIGHYSVAGIGRITAAPVADNCMIRNTSRHRNGVHGAEKTAFR